MYKTDDPLTMSKGRDDDVGFVRLFSPLYVCVKTSLINF